jgi:hypothetical protein
MSNASLSTDDVAHLAHVVIVEDEARNTIRIFEYERGLIEEAHLFAQNTALSPGFKGRVIVTVRVRTIGRLTCKS